MFARTISIALTLLFVSIHLPAVSYGQQTDEPKPLTEEEAEARFGVKSKPEPEPQTEPQVEHTLSQTSYTRGGWYMAIGGAVVIENSSLVGDPDRHMVSGGGNIRLGNRHNRWFATEVKGIYAHTYTTPESEYKTWGVWLSERVYLTKGRFQPFLAGGLGAIQLRSKILDGATPPGEDPDANNSSSWGFSPYFGGGAELFWNENFISTIFVNYYITTGSITDHDFIMAGIGFAFY